MRGAWPVLLTAILLGMRLGKVLWKDDFDLQGAIAAMFLVHSGRLVMEMPGINGILASVSGRSQKGRRALASQFQRAAPIARDGPAPGPGTAVEPMTRRFCASTGVASPRGVRRSP